MKIVISMIVVLGLFAGGAYVYGKYYWRDGGSSFRTAKIERGEMMPTISATGTIEPEEVVDVGAQVAGLVKELNVDYGSKVEPQSVMARIDDTVYQAQVDQADATLKRAQADLGQMKAKLAQAKADLDRAKALIQTKAIANADYDAAVANYEVARANVDVGDAAIKQAAAALNLSKTNLGYTVIKSPVKGVIIDRRVNVGQTVVAALNAPSLFLLAKDLTRMQVWASVNEADIGRIHPGLSVHFTIDAFPDDTFVGEVSQIRMNATMTQNVVTYTVVISTDNSNLKLLPYLTANVQFEIEKHHDVLRVPNAALRWKPRKQQIAPEIREEAWEAMNNAGRGGKSDRKSGQEKSSEKSAKNATSTVTTETAKIESKDTATTSGGTATAQTSEGWKARAEQTHSQRGESGQSAAHDKPLAQKDGKGTRASRLSGVPVSEDAIKKAKRQNDKGRIWIKDGEWVKPANVRIVATDGTMTEIQGNDIQEDMDVVVGENVASDKEGDTTNPFAPKLFKGGSKR